MDKKKSLLNVSVSILFKVLFLFGAIFVRRYIIVFLGSEINGLNSLYLNIMDVLAVAELGVGEAITFCMYRPIVEKDNNKVSALYTLINKAYLCIAGVVFLLGLALMPFLKFLVKGYETTGVSLYLTFGIVLLSVCITYLFGAKTSLINAHKNNYVTTTIASCGKIFQYILQIVVLITTQSFIAFLVCRVISAIAQWIVTDIIAAKWYSHIIKNKQTVDDETKGDIIKNVTAMFMHKIASILVGATDSIIISAFVGIATLGIYSNYTTIMTSMTSILALFFIPLTSIIGHMYVKENSANIKKYYSFFHAFNYCLSIVFFLGYYSIIDNLIVLFFGDGLEQAKSITIVITINYFIQFTRRSTLLFRDATGTFYNDRYKSLVEGLVNLVLSLLFAYYFGVVGVLIATIITNAFICHTVEPYMLYKYAFKTSVKKYYFKNYGYIVLFIIALFVFDRISITADSFWYELLLNGCLSVIVALVTCAFIFITNSDFRFYSKKLLFKVLKKKNK